MSIKQLDEFIKRQGIKSAELCKIIDNIKSQLKQKDEEIKEKEDEIFRQKQNVRQVEIHAGVIRQKLREELVGVTEQLKEKNEEIESLKEKAVHDNQLQKWISIIDTEELKLITNKTASHLSVQMLRLEKQGGDVSILMDFEKNNKEIVNQEYIKLLQQELETTKRSLDDLQVFIHRFQEEFYLKNSTSGLSKLYADIVEYDIAKIDK